MDSTAKGSKNVFDGSFKTLLDSQERQSSGSSNEANSPSPRSRLFTLA
jgi:hypothetical protein